MIMPVATTRRMASTIPPLVVNLLIGRWTHGETNFSTFTRFFVAYHIAVVVFHRPASVFLPVDWAFALFDAVIILRRVRSWSKRVASWILLRFLSARVNNLILIRYINLSFIVEKIFAPYHLAKKIIIIFNFENRYKIFDNNSSWIIWVLHLHFR